MNLRTECKYLDPEDCDHFSTYCTKIKSGIKKGKCQRNRITGLDLPKDELLAYLRQKQSTGTKVIEEYNVTKSEGIKISGEITSTKDFTVIQTIIIPPESTQILNKKIEIVFMNGKDTIFTSISYIKQMSKYNLVLDTPLENYSGNSRYNDSRNFSTEVNVLQINWVGTDEKYAGNRFAVYGMYLLEQIAKKKFDIKYITLEDHTTVEPPKNLYYKLNFRLLSDYTWIDWHKWTTEKGMTDVPTDERMISIEDFEQSEEIKSIQKLYTLG